MPYTMQKEGLSGRQMSLRTCERNSLMNAYSTDKLLKRLFQPRVPALRDFKLYHVQWQCPLVIASSNLVYRLCFTSHW